jgi:hypothetical protein
MADSAWPQPSAFVTNGQSDGLLRRLRWPWEKSERRLRQLDNCSAHPRAEPPLTLLR